MDHITRLIEQYKYTFRPLKGIFLTSEPIQQIWDVNNLSMNNVREIAIGFPPSGGCRQLHIYTYSNQELNKIRPKRLVDIKLASGFALEKEYYEPKYPSYLDQTYQYYGALNWVPTITIEPNSNYTFKITNHF